MVEMNPEDSNFLTSIAPGVAAELRARAQGLSDRPRKSSTGYLAVIHNEQRHARRVGRRLDLTSDEMESLVQWHLRNVLFHTRASRPSRESRGMTYGVTVKRLPRTRTGRLLSFVSRSPFASWLPSFISNRVVEVRAWYLRLAWHGRSS